MSPRHTQTVAGSPVPELRRALLESGLARGTVEKRLWVLRSAEGICRRLEMDLAYLGPDQVEAVVALLSESGRRIARPAFSSLWAVLGHGPHLPAPPAGVDRLTPRSRDALEDLRRAAAGRRYLDGRIAALRAEVRKTPGTIGFIEQATGTLDQVDVDSLYADLMWELDEYAYRRGGGNAIGAAAIVRRVSRHHGVLSAGRPLPRLPRAVQEEHRRASHRQAAMPLGDLVAMSLGENEVEVWIELGDFLLGRSGWRLAGADGLPSFKHESSALWAAADGPRKRKEPTFTLFRQSGPDPDDVDWWDFMAIRELEQSIEAFERGSSGLPVPTGGSVRRTVSQ